MGSTHILSSGETFTVPRSPSQDIKISYIGGVGTFANINLNGFIYVIANVLGVFVWDYYLYSYTFTTIGETYNQNAGGMLYAIRYNGDMLFTITKLNATEQRLSKFRYRFGGYRYGLRGSAQSGPDDYISQKSGLFAFPKGDLQDDNNG